LGESGRVKFEGADEKPKKPKKPKKKNVALGVKGDWRVRLTNLLPSMSRLSRENMGASTSHNPMCLHGLLQE
jgi:hypothetical protein